MLDAFLRDLRRRPHRLGEADCVLVLADWWMMNHPGAPDPAAAYRGAYDTPETLSDLLERDGPLVRLIGKVARSVGCPRSREPEPGDIGVVRLGDALFGAILSPSRRWTVRTARSVAASSEFKLVAAWSIR
jgi:uncharacterized protein DUF6950